MNRSSAAAAATDMRTVAVVACVLLVTLRLFIGWQLLYEGIWKIETLSTPRPWTGAGFLGAAQGPFRETYRDMSGDPDGFGWLDYDTVAGKWDAWRDRFESHYGPLTEEQTAKLDDLIDGPAQIVQPLAALPEGMDAFPPRGIADSAIRYDAEKRALIVDGELRLTPSERDRLWRADPAWDASNVDGYPDTTYSKAIKRVTDIAGRLSYKQKLRALLLGDPERNGDEIKINGKVAEKQTGEVETYRYRLDEYNAKLATADQSFEFDHLGKQWGEIQSLKSELTGPVKALGGEMIEKAHTFLTTEQKARGREPNAWNAVRVSDTLVITGLTTLGTLLIIGCWTRLAAVTAGVMLLSFYLVWPPWPGVPTPPGVEHSLVVNKNLIEVAALFAIAALPTGTWFGVDGALARLWRSFRSRPQTQPAAPTAVANTEPAAEAVETEQDELEPAAV
ncbi:MAG: hypothetical protein AAF532_11575 [Planctomycetota bacterium]